MAVSFKAKISVPEQVLVRTFKNESVLLNLDTECYHGLDDVGTRMWQALSQSENIQAAFEALLPEYEVDGATLHKDLEAFIESMVERGLVEVIDR